MYRRISREKLEEHLIGVKIPEVKNRVELFRKSLKDTKVNDMYIEFGVFTGGTINIISSIIPDKTVYGFDSWKGLPDNYTETFKKGSFVMEIPKTFNPNIELLVGMIENTLPRFLERHPEKIGFVHMDVDVYSVTKYVLDTLAPRLQIGSVIQFDEIFEVENGYWYLDEFDAWTEFLKEHNIKYDYIGLVNSHCSFIITSIN